jgi:hypothetical protein
MTDIGKRACASLLAVGALFSLVSGGTAEARQWKPTPSALAQDYVVITDQRPGNEIVMLMWVAPEMVDSAEIRPILAKYIVLGVVDAHMNSDGTASFGKPDVSLTDARGNQIHALSGDEIPPAVAGTLSTLQSAFTQSMGKLGEGFHWVAYDGSTVHSCQAGSGFSVQTLNEKYTYDAPIPGCP